MPKILSPRTCSFWLICISSTKTIYISLQCLWKTGREGISNDCSIFHDVGSHQWFQNHWSIPLYNWYPKSRFQAKYYSSDTVNTCFYLSHITFTARSRCQNTEVDRGHTQIILQQHCIHQHYNSSILISRTSRAVFYSQMHEAVEETVCRIKELKLWNSLDSHSTDKTDSTKAILTTKIMFPLY